MKKSFGKHLLMSMLVGMALTTTSISLVHAATPVDGKVVLKKILENQSLTEDEKNWFINVFGAFKQTQDGIQIDELFLKTKGYLGAPLIGQNNTQIPNAATYDGAVYGRNNVWGGRAYILGEDSSALSSNSTVAVGYQLDVMGEESIGIGMHSTVLPYNSESVASGGIVIGSNALSNYMSTAIGAGAIASGEFSLALGSGAEASSEQASTFIKNVNYQNYDAYLQQNLHDEFGVYDSAQGFRERRDQVNQKLFEKNKDWFSSMKITSYEDLVSKLRDKPSEKTKTDEIMHALAIKALIHSQDYSQNTLAPMALGYQSKAYGNFSAAMGVGSVASADNSVALGYASVVVPEDIIDSPKTPYSGVKLSVNGNGLTGAAKETLLGAISVGNKSSAGTNLRQILYVGDGTRDTDAVNLRQLRGALFNGVKAGNGVTITPQDDPQKPDYGTITINASQTVVNASDLQAGKNITIKDNVISAKDTVYEAGDNVSITKVAGKEDTYKISFMGSTGGGGGTNFSLKGDKGDALQVTDGKTVNLIGGATDLDSRANIGVETTANGAQFRLAKHINTEGATFSKAGSVSSTTVDDKGVVINSQNQAPISLTTEGLDNGGQRIRHIADGVAPDDAVSVRQLKQVQQKMKKHSDAGVASALAAAGIPQSMRGGKSMFGIAGGSYNGQTAMAVGFSHTSDNARMVLKVSGTTDSNSKYGISAGFGYEF